MCGICGLVTSDPRRPDEGLLRAMTDAIAHRGPDGEGTWAGEGVGLGQRRLAILDLSDLARQPMRDPATGLVITYNGEVYNFRPLRAELEALGHAFRGTGDTEVVLQAWARWGPEALPRLNGMFALAVWDPRTRELHLARDRFGIKPLVYARRPDGLVFASEAKALRAAGAVDGSVDVTALHQFLWWGAALGERTLDAGVRKLPAAGHLVWRDGEVTIDQWWDPRGLLPITPTDEEAAAELVPRLGAAVERHLISDVPVGVFLSGGIDSSAIAALAARRSGRIRTWSAGFDFAAVSELERARRTAAALGTEHHELFVRTDDLPDVLTRLVEAHDGPFGDAANVPLYLLCEALGGRPKVVLQGDGGDEIFGGYRRYALLARSAWLRPVSAAAWRLLGRGPASPLGARASESGRRRRVLRMARALGHPDPALTMALLLTLETDLDAPLRFLRRDLREAPADPFAPYREAHRRYGHLDPAQRMLVTDTRILLPDTYLEKVDKPTMAHGIEVRVPMLDTELTAWAMALPSHLKVRRGQTKWLLRKALRGVVPDEVLDGPKLGFGVPYGAWLRGPLGPWMQEVLLDRSARLFEPGALEPAIRAHRTGAADHGYLLYKCLQLALWDARRTAAAGARPAGG